MGGRPHDLRTLVIKTKCLPTLTLNLVVLARCPNREKEGGALDPTNDGKTRKLLLIKMLAKRQLMTEKTNI